jgi:hypothetical protein
MLIILEKPLNPHIEKPKTKTTLGVIWPGHLPEFIRITGIN